MRTPVQQQPPRRQIKLVHAGLFRPIGREGPGRRLVNLVVAAIGLAFTLPLMLLLAILIKLTSRGPVLFKQMRIGLDRRALSRAGGNTRRRIDLGGRTFTMYKFRTMY